MNFYDVLGVSRDADASDIRSAYRTLAQVYHPDVNEHPDASDQFKVLTKAREVLTDGEERAAYDRLGHQDYVNTRIDGDLPSPEMTPRDEDGSAVDVGTVTARGGGSSSGAGGATSAGSASTSSTASGGSSASTASSGRTASTGSTASTGGTSGTGSASPGAGGGTGTGSPSGTSSASGASTGRTTSSGASSSGGRSASAGGTSHDSGGGGRSRESAGGHDRGTAHSTPPTPGGTPGGSRAAGPERISREQSQRAARKMGTLGETVRAHFAASNRWLGVTGAALLYFAGVAGYLQANAGVVGQLWADLTSPDPQRVAKALGGGRYDVPDLFAVASGEAGAGGLAGAVAVVGAVALPVALGLAVSGLRRHTTWRPSWMHLLGALGPLASVALGYGTGEGALLPVAHVPLLVHLLLLVGFPSVVVGSFLLNRLVVVVPLRRREDLGLP